jgi:hypothetical protein
MRKNTFKLNSMSPVEIRTTDADLGGTLLLWLAEDLNHFALRSSKKVRFVDGKNELGIDDEKDMLTIYCPASALNVPISGLVQMQQKIKKRLGLASSPFAHTHEMITDRYLAARSSLRNKLKLAPDVQACRMLLRVDDFPSVHGNSSEFIKFHELAHQFHIPYLLAVTPFLDRGKGPMPLSEPELKILQRCVREGATLALHGFTHKSRISQYNSELVSMPAAELEENIAKAKSQFKSLGLPLEGFVAPFNTYDPITVSVIAKHFKFFCGGPESVLSLGFRSGPSVFQNSLYVPSYHGVYDLKGRELDNFKKLMAKAQGFLLPVSLHWTNEAMDDFKTFRSLCELIRDFIMPWNDFVSYAESLKGATVSRGDL